MVRATAFDGPGRALGEERLLLSEARDDLVRLGAGGVCGSDLHVADGYWPVGGRSYSAP